MKFWDTSSIVPLVTREDTTDAMAAVLAADPEMIVSCFTAVEVTSAIWRQRRTKGTDELRREAEALLWVLEERWLPVDDIAVVTAIARELIARHPLKAADALQLASALSLVGIDRSGLTFVTLDHRLAEAARSERLSVITL